MSEKPVAEVKKIIQPSTEIIGELEKLLEEARRGELRGIAFSCVYVEGLGAHGWATEADADSDRLLSRIVRLQSNFTARLER